MRLVSLQVWHWKGLDHEALMDFSPGLNLVYGPNEAGKSRLFQALRVALFESHKGQATYKRELQGWISTESPRVEVVFELGGKDYRLEKQFLKGAFCRLEGEGETLKNEAAEGRLQQLLGVGASGSRELGKEEQGLWRLLWVTQGTSHQAAHRDLNSEPKARLQNLVAREVGEITAGEQGEHLLERVREEMRRYWTAAKQAPTGEFGEALKRQAAAEAALAGARDKKQAAEGDTEALIRCRRRLDALEPRRSDQKRRVQEARGRQQAADQVERRLTAEEGRLASLELRVAQARSGLNQRSEVGRAVAQKKAEQKALGERLVAQERGLADLERGSVAAREALASAERAKDKARLEARHARSLARRERLATEVTELEERCREAQQEADRLAAAERLLSGVAISRQDLESFEEGQNQLQEARVRLEASGVRVRLQALQALEVSLPEGSQELSPKGDLVRTVTEAETWEIPGILRFEMEPGGRDLESWKEKVLKLEKSAAARLEEWGASTLEEVRDLVQGREQARSNRQMHRRFLERWAPQGVEALKGRLAGLKQDLASLAEIPKGLTLEAADAALEEAEGRLEGARQGKEAAASRLHEARLGNAALVAQARALEESLGSSEARLAQFPEPAVLEAEVQEQEKLQGEALLRREALKGELEAAGGTGTQALVTQAERALARLEEERSQAMEELRSLEGKLQARGEEGLHEALQEAEQDLEEAQSERRRVERRAQAVLKLWQTLEEERRTAQERFTEPVRRRIEPYLKVLFPGSELALDDQWQVAGLATGNLQENLADLSFGAQEQIGVLVRLGLAEILAQDERLPLVLDDALVHTDADRREAMLQILGRASERLQVIVLTCHESDYDALGPSRSYRLSSPR
ncbi:MAG: AAA family ATPase [Deltaproteobacteria bacterium]|nr:AAA family ATPase [Deltaproteobacteria bacterium]